jgi:hypothetical protein
MMQTRHATQIIDRWWAQKETSTQRNELTNETDEQNRNEKEAAWNEM